MIKLKELLDKTSLKAAGMAVGVDIRMVDGRLECEPIDPDDPRYSLDFVMPSRRMVEACRADDFVFCQPYIDAGMMTVEQMHRAAVRYQLGQTRSGAPMFWMIDEWQEPLDAHIGADGWLSTLLKAREPMLRAWHPRHCLFGLHLLMDEVRCMRADVKPLVCIVESEVSAVVLSVLFPEFLWMAYAELSFVTADLFAPLAGRKVVIYPRTDPGMSGYLFFDELAEEVRMRYGIRISVDALLEEHASDEQKSRCIDLLDFICEGAS